METGSPSGESVKSLSNELSMHSRQQFEVLQKSPYLRMPAAEASEYDKRPARITEICHLILKFRSRTR
jgi:hypothetical protein